MKRSKCEHGKTIPILDRSEVNNRNVVFPTDTSRRGPSADKSRILQPRTHKPYI
jgi:hypothetical protein